MNLSFVVYSFCQYVSRCFYDPSLSWVHFILLYLIIFISYIFPTLKYVLLLDKHQWVFLFCLYVTLANLLHVVSFYCAYRILSKRWKVKATTAATTIRTPDDGIRRRAKWICPTLDGCREDPGLEANRRKHPSGTTQVLLFITHCACSASTAGNIYGYFPSLQICLGPWLIDGVAGMFTGKANTNSCVLALKTLHHIAAVVVKTKNRGVRTWQRETFVSNLQYSGS